MAKPRYLVDDAGRKIVACKIKRLVNPYGGLTRDGYTKRSGAPTSRMIRLAGEKRWRRLMVWQFSNMSTLFVTLNGKPHIVRDFDLPKGC